MRGIHVIGDIIQAMNRELSAIEVRLSSHPVDEILRESEAFFTGDSKVHQTLKRLSIALKENSIPYAICGDMALNLYGFTCEGLEQFKERLVGRGYALAFTGASKSFRDSETQVKVETLITGEYPGDGKPKPVSIPDPQANHIERDGYHVIPLETLIELKLASGMTAPHRLRDLADVQDLISVLGLPLELEKELDESVRGEYRRLWESVQQGREDR